MMQNLITKLGWMILIYMQNIPAPQEPWRNVEECVGWFNMINTGLLIEGPGSGVVDGEMSQPLFHDPLELWSPFIPRSPLRPVGYSLAKNGYFYDRNQKLWEWVGNKECSQTSQWQIVVKLLDFDVGWTNTYKGPEWWVRRWEWV